MKKKTYVFAGASWRAHDMYAKPMYDNFKDCTELRGVYDINPGRCAYISQSCGNMPIYDDFDRMIETEKPDVVIVTTVDAHHSDYIIRALELGCDVITEKPMTIDAERCKAILAAEKKYGKQVRITFNYRYAPYMTKIKQLLHDGVIGDVYSVHFEWLLDRNMDVNGHGVSYFRRWNSIMEKSGGLLVHKSTHHFDLVNWWLDAEPEKVAAFGKLNAYGKNGPFRGKNCRNCEHTAECPYYYRLTDFESKFYAANEQYDGYYKDGCVFRDEINIYDTMAAIVQYDGGQMLSYSLNATTPYEGWRVVMNGSKGRLEAGIYETGVLSQRIQDTIQVFDLQDNITEYAITRVKGGHGGGDERLHEALFRGVKDDPLGHFAGTRDGANSILIGAAANISIREGRMVELNELRT